MTTTQAESWALSWPRRTWMLIAGVVLGTLVVLATTAVASNRQHATGVHVLAGGLGLASVALVVSSATLLAVGEGSCGVESSE